MQPVARSGAGIITMGRFETHTAMHRRLLLTHTAAGALALLAGCASAQSGYKIGRAHV